MIAFADASALVKLYADERDHEVVRELQVVVIAEISRVEVTAALWRKVRMGEIAAEEAAVLVRDFVADYEGTPSESPRFQIVATAGSILREAARLCGVHPVRAYDAVQLASALVTARASDENIAMAVFDLQLRNAAAREGLTLVP